MRIYDRPGRVICEDFAFETGEPLTVFAMSEPRWAPELDVFPQHTILFGFARPHGLENAQLHNHTSTASEFYPDRTGKLADYYTWDLNTGVYTDFVMDQGTPWDTPSRR